MRRVVLICGPPGSGKTTLARTLGLPVYDRDDREWRGERHFRAALAKLGSTPLAQAAVIRAGATPRARAEAAALITATETTVLLVPADECRRRVTARGARAKISMPAQMAAIDAWWARYQPGTIAAPQLLSTPSGPHWSRDPLYQANRRIVLARRDPCARCGGPIDYDGPRYRRVGTKRIENPLAFDCGHITPGHTDHSLANLQAEHTRCNRLHGAKLGALRRWGTEGPTRNSQPVVMVSEFRI